jgi:FkbH-like protein
MLSFNDLKRNLKKDPGSLRKINLSVLCENSGQLLVQAIKGYGIECGYNVNINDCGYDELNLQVFEPQSQLNTFKSDYILIIPSVQKLQKKFYDLSFSEKEHFADDQIKYIQQIIDTLSATTPAKIIFSNYLETDDAVFGNYSSKINSSFLFQLRKLNFGLMGLAQKNSGLFICDTVSLQNYFGVRFITDNKFYINSDIVFSIDFLPHFAKNVLDIINSIEGRIRKCLIMDLDNTMWGGIIGDDGIENIQVGDLGIGKAYTELQTWARQLKERGIILAVCSKNSENIAREPFEKHPDMVLRMDDFAIFVANWETKVDNIRHIQSVLNIGFDSMVFIDDNPFERNLIIENIPEVTVPDLPEDPAEYLPFLKRLNLFETASFTEEDKLRTGQYREEAKRTIYQRSFTNEGEYLRNLGMIAKVESFNPFNIPRISQLTQRSNQFNLRTRRYSENEIKNLASSEKHVCLSFSLKDKFGDHGLIAVVILEKTEKSELFIDTWIMSCRILKRGMEDFILNLIIKTANNMGCSSVVGEFIPTSKNGIVSEHYKNLGFISEGNYWKIAVKDHVPKETFIQTTEKQLQ